MDAQGIEPTEVVSASKKLGETDAKKLVRAASKVIVAKGKKVNEFDGGRATKDVVSALLGPTGNLRAPTLVSGKTVLVGFNEDAYAEALG